ncbi:MAG: hypothetical protein U1E26_12775 [Coriobacteriia bacterium]|nr:hypothetical protein [bacterium]MDZ4170506.1 hypothetical protein [Coriobacteriia bacterium]
MRINWWGLGRRVGRWAGYYALVFLGWLLHAASLAGVRSQEFDTAQGFGVLLVAVWCASVLLSWILEHRDRDALSDLLEAIDDLARINTVEQSLYVCALRLRYGQVASRELTS